MLRAVRALPDRKPSRVAGFRALKSLRRSNKKRYWDERHGIRRS
jgi:hypothetical protein